MRSTKFTLIALLAIFSAFTSIAQTADEIVQKHLTAIGGAEAWKKITSMTMEGSMKVQGAEVLVDMTVLNGKGMRQNISVAGMTGYTIVTPTGGWNYMPFQGQAKPEAMSEETVKETIDELDVQGPLVDYQAKGHKVEYLGKDDVEGTEAFKLKVTYKSGKVSTVLLDPATYYIIRTIAKQEANGQEMEVVTNLSNYTKLPEGIVVPMSYSLPYGEMTITKMKMNQPVDESIFKPANN
jgi:hypothetical protein